MRSDHNSWRDAPPWALELREMMGIMIEQQEYSMSQADDLNNAVTSLANAFAAEHTAVVSEMDALAKALASSSQPDPVLADAVNQAIANVTHITGQMATDAASLTSSVPGATPVPAPTVTQPATAPTVTAPTIDVPVSTGGDAAAAAVGVGPASGAHVITNTNVSPESPSDVSGHVATEVDPTTGTPLTPIPGPNPPVVGQTAPPVETVENPNPDGASPAPVAPIPGAGNTATDKSSTT